MEKFCGGLAEHFRAVGLGAVVDAKGGENGLQGAYIFAGLVEGWSRASLDERAYAADDWGITFIIGQPPVPDLRHAPELGHFAAKGCRVGVATCQD